LKNTQISNFIKIGLVGAELCHADGRTDAMKLTAVPQLFERPYERLGSPLW